MWNKRQADMISDRERFDWGGRTFWFYPLEDEDGSPILYVESGTLADGIPLGYYSGKQEAIDYIKATYRENDY